MEAQRGPAATRWRSARSSVGYTLLVRACIGLVIGAVLVVTFVRLVNFGSVYRRLEHLNAGYALLCGLAFLTAYAIRAVRWRRLLAPWKVGIPRVVAIYLVATFVNWLLPVRAGELAKSLMLRRSDGIPVSQSLATVAMDKAMDLVPAVVLLAIVPVVGLHLGRLLWLLVLSASLVVCLAGLVLAIASRRREWSLELLNRALAATLPTRVRTQAGPVVARFVDTLFALIRKPRLLLVAAALTAAAVAFDALFCFLAFRAVGASVPILVVVYGYTLYNLAYMLPTPPGQVGSNELVGLLVFSGVFGISRSAVGAMFLFSHPWTAILLAASGLICLSAMGLTLRGTLRLAPSSEALVRK